MAMQNKRKRETHDMAGGRAAPSMAQTDDFSHHYLQMDDTVDAADDGMNFAAAFTQHSADPSEASNQVGGDGTGQSASDTAAAAMAQYHTMTVPQSTEQSFMTGANEADKQGSIDQGSANPQHRASTSFTDFDTSAIRSSPPNPNGAASPTSNTNTGMSAPKPPVGSDEWHKVRKDNHKEVERRRRETINEGINELAKIVPGCEKNKGSILQRAVQFITQLKENETQNIEKWTLEKLLTEQAIAELSTSCDKLKAECQRAWTECEQWKKAAQKAGASIDDDKGDADGEDAD